MADIPTATVTNPILLWLYRHGWEDPDWGQSRVGQLVINVAIYDLASRLSDSEVGAELQKTAQRAVAKLSQQIVNKG